VVRNHPRPLGFWRFGGHPGWPVDTHRHKFLAIDECRELAPLTLPPPHHFGLEVERQLGIGVPEFVLHDDGRLAEGKEQAGECPAQAVRPDAVG